MIDFDVQAVRRRFPVLAKLHDDRREAYFAGSAIALWPELG